MTLKRHHCKYSARFLNKEHDVVNFDVFVIVQEADEG